MSLPNMEGKLMSQPTLDQLRAHTIVDLVTAARALGIGRTKAYQLARDNQFPCRIIKIGRGYHVPTADLLLLLGAPPT